MLIYRILLAQYAGKLKASGRAARWNPNEVDMIYTASSRSLACLENVVHRNQLGLNQVFSVMTIECPDHINITTFHLNDLPANWKDYNHMPVTQKMGEGWIKNGETAVLSVPSSVIDEERNYLLNPKHKDFEQIRIIKTQPFVFDGRIKNA